MTVSSARRTIATVVWVVAVAVAVLLAVGALLSALLVDPQTVVVRQLVDGARFVAGPFGHLFVFYRDVPGEVVRTPDVAKERLVNWGLAAVVCLLLGRALDLLIRPRAARDDRSAD